MAHFPKGAPLLVTTSNGALRLDAPLVCLDRCTSSKFFFDTNGAPRAWCAISSFNTNGASEGGAPLVYTNGAPHVWCAISVISIYSPFPSSVLWKVLQQLGLSLLVWWQLFVSIWLFCNSCSMGCRVCRIFRWTLTFYCTISTNRICRIHPLLIPCHSVFLPLSVCHIKSGRQEKRITI